jgi:hypothetical protein
VTTPAHDPHREAAIRRRATELWEIRGRKDGHSVEDWVQAEKEVTAAWQNQISVRRAHLLVKVREVLYTGEYDPEDAAGYKPGEFAPGEAIALRFDGEIMFVRRRNGGEFQTRIEKKAPATIEKA